MAEKKDFLDHFDRGLFKPIDLPDNIGMSLRSGALLDLKPVPNKKTPKDDLPPFIKKQLLENFDTKDLFVTISFPKDTDVDSAVLFLLNVGAIPLIPANSIGSNYDYMFIAKKQLVKDFINKCDARKNPDVDPKLKHVYDTLKMKFDYCDAEESAQFLYVQRECFNVNQGFFGTIHKMRDRLNILYAFCSDNVRTDKKTPIVMKSEPILRQYILHYVKQIENAADAIEQETIFNELLHHFAIDASGFVYKYNYFFFTLGVLKFSKPLSMEIMLDDASHAELFNLDTSKTYRVMHSINVSKINQTFDFSNFDINGNFDCSRAKSHIVLPHKINGILDCSFCEGNLLAPGTKIPEGTKMADFSGTIKDFDTLSQMVFPKSLRIILLVKSTLNAVLKDKDALEKYEQFSKNHPNIQIWDSKQKQSLREMLEQQQAKTQVEKKVKEVAPVVKKTVIQTKTDEWLTRKEIISLLERDELFADTAGLDRLVQRATNANSALSVENRLVNNVAVACMHVDSIPGLKHTVIQIIEDDERRTKQKETAQTVKPTKQQEKKVSEKKIKKKQPVNIEKYIPKQIWKEICNACGDSSQLLYSVLERINRINVCYDTQNQKGAPVQYIDKDEIWQSVPNTEFKRGKAATQFIENNDNRRIVWTINSDDKVMVAIAFFLNHADNACDIKGYNSIALPNAGKGYLMDGKTFVDKALVSSADYLNVSDLLKQYKPKTHEEPEVPEVPAVSKAESTPKPQNPKKAPVVVKKEKPVLNNKPVEPTVTLPKIDLSKIKKEPVKHERHYTLVDVDAAKREIDLFIDNLDKRIKELSVTMEEQKDNPIAQLRILDQIKRLVKDKMKVMCK